MINEVWKKKLACVLNSPERYFLKSKKNSSIITNFEYDQNNDLLVYSIFGCLFKVSRTTIKWLLPNTIKIDSNFLYFLFKECFNILVLEIGDMLFIYRRVIKEEYFEGIPNDPKIVLCNSLEFWIDEENKLAYKVDIGINEETLHDIYFKASAPLFKYESSEVYISIQMNSEGKLKLIGVKNFKENIESFINSKKYAYPIYPQIFLSKKDLLFQDLNVKIVNAILSKKLNTVSLEHPILDNRVFSLHYKPTDDALLKLKHEYYSN